MSDEDDGFESMFDSMSRSPVLKLKAPRLEPPKPPILVPTAVCASVDNIDDWVASNRPKPRLQVTPAVQDIVTPGFQTSLSIWLLKFHDLFKCEPLSGGYWEFAFVMAAREAGHSVRRMQDQGPYDCLLNGQQVQLKTETYEPKENWLYISKYKTAGSTAAEGNDQASLTRRKTSFLSSLSGWDRLLLLRRFGTGPFTYELLEVPKSVLLEAEKYAPRPTGNLEAKNWYGELITPDIKITFQGSGASKTSLGVRRDVCTLHGIWDVTG